MSICKYNLIDTEDHVKSKLMIIISIAHSINILINGCKIGCSVSSDTYGSFYFSNKCIEILVATQLSAT